MKQYFFFLILIISVLVLSACGPKAECETSAQCPVRGECFTPMCQDGQCSSVPKQGCCGNGLCDGGEDPCSCNADCKFSETTSGLCEGKISYQVANSPRPKEGLYTQWYCSDDRGCVAGVPPEQVQTVKLSSDHGSSQLKFQMTASISKPYVIGTGEYDVKVTLMDFDSEWVAKPIRITKVQVMSGSELLGERVVAHSFAQIGSTFETALDLSIVLDKLEQDRLLTTKVYYEYESLDYEGTPTIKRNSFEKYHNMHPFVDPVKV